MCWIEGTTELLVSDQDKGNLIPGKIIILKVTTAVSNILLDVVSQGILQLNVL